MCFQLQCYDVLWFYKFLLARTAELSWALWIKCHCARTWERELHMWKVENCSRASAPPPLIFCHLLPSLFPLPLSVLSPSHLFVLGTYQPERGKRRREGGGVSQHVRQERGGKRERIACGEGTRKAGWEVGSRLKESSFFFFHPFAPSHYQLLLIKLVVKVLFCASQRKDTNKRKEGENMRMGHHNGKMGERARWRRWKLSWWGISTSSHPPTTPPLLLILLPPSLWLWILLWESLLCLGEKVESWHLRPAEGNCFLDQPNRTLRDGMYILKLAQINRDWGQVLED